MERGNNRTAGQTYVNVGTGYSDVDDSFRAGKEAAKNSIAFMKRRYKLEDVSSDDLTLTMVFSSTRYNLEQMLEGVRAITGKNCPLVGCTTAGNITNEGVRDDSVSVMALSSEMISAGTGVGEELNKDAAGSGERAVSEALEKMRRYDGKKLSKIKQMIFRADPLNAIKFNPFSVIMFPQGRVSAEFILYDEEIIRGMRREIGYYVPIIGGSSANGSRMKRSFQFCDGNVYTNSVVCVVLYNPLNRGFSVSHPFVPMPIKKRPQVTKLKEHYPPLFPEGSGRGYTILELDGVPAAKRYFEIMRDKITENSYEEWLEEVGDQRLSLIKGGKLQYHPFGLTDSEGNAWMKKMSSIKNDGSIELTSLIPEDSVLAIMELRGAKTAIELIPETAKEAITDAKYRAKITNSDEFAVVFVFDCDARYRMIKEKDPKLELEAIKSVTGENAPIIGFYGYGEQLSSLLIPMERLEQTCTVMVLSQKLQGEA